jgi:alpha-galactosidase
VSLIEWYRSQSMVRERANGMPKITFIGAGSAVFTRNLIADLLTYPELHGSEICLMDIDEHRLQLVQSLAKKMAAQQNAQFTISATTNRLESLRNADYVIVTIQVGGLNAYEMDIQIPRKYGVEQCIGDTLGPGGVFRGLRHLAVISELCSELEQVSPHAVVLQYTNPMVIISRAIQASSSIRSVGLCHSVQGTSEQLAQYIQAPADEITYWVAGINHMAWFLKFEWNGQDAYPLLREQMNNPVVYGKDPVRFELMRHFGAFVTESSGHASEYYAFFRKNPQQLEALIRTFSDPQSEWFEYGRTGGYLNHCKSEVKQYFDWFEAQLNHDVRFDICRSNEYGAQIIHAMETNRPLRINGNVANRGSITNLPFDACVEVPCMIDSNGIHPVLVGALPEQLAALIRTNLNVQELAAQGHLQGNRELIRQAIKLDPLTSSVCSLAEIDRMVDEMFDAQALWLPQFSKS